jgi:hypothetical protein
MRELKFRAWQESQKKMHQEIGLHHHIMTNHTMCDEDECGYVAKGTGKGEYTLFANQSEWPIMQFTGLLDKNGKEIYEGDVTNNGYVVLWNNEKALFAEHTYQQVLGKWSVMSYPLDSRWIQIIGNIYENPDLL